MGAAAVRRYYEGTVTPYDANVSSGTQ